ncbi:MAG: LysR family transcriptional regulator [Myxococcota bacterium]
MQDVESLRWDDLKVLLALHRHGSLKRAAEQLQVNISTVSRRLSTLEEQMGAHLFDRTPDGTRATAAVERLLPYAQSMEEAARGFARGLDGFEVEPEGAVRLTAPPGFVDHFLAPRIIELSDAFPRLRLQVVSTIRYADLSRHEADIALRIRRPEAGDFVVTRLATSGYALVASPDVVAQIKRLRRTKDVRWVTWGEDLAHQPDAQWVARHVEPAHVVLESSSMTAQIEAVRAGIGVMIAPTAYAELPHLQAMPCVARLRESLAELPQGSLWMVGHRATREIPRIAAVWQWLKSVFESYPQ